MTANDVKRGPLLIMDGEKDHTVPWAIANASYKRQARNKGVTEIVKIPGRGQCAHDRQLQASSCVDLEKPSPA